MVRWVVGSIYHGGTVELFLVPYYIMYIINATAVAKKI